MTDDERAAHQARLAFLGSIWPTMIDRLRDPERFSRYPAARRLLEAGANAEDLSRALRVIAYETAFAMLDHLDEGRDPDLDDDAPGWKLIEVSGAGVPTGRDLGLLHEDLQSLDPSGNEALDLFK